MLCMKRVDFKVEKRFLLIKAETTRIYKILLALRKDKY